MTLVSASPAHEHLLKLRAAGGTYEAIGRAAGIGAMTVHGIANGRRLKVQADVARRLLTVTEDDVCRSHPSPNGTMWRLRALVAMGHSCTRMAWAAGLPPATLRRIVRGEAITVTPEVRQAVLELFGAWVGKDATVPHPPGEARRPQRAQTRCAEQLAMSGRARRGRTRPAQLPPAMRLATRHWHQRRRPIHPGPQQKEDRMKRHPQGRQTRPMQRPGKRPEHALPSSAQVQVATGLQHLGVVSAEVGSGTGTELPELSRHQLAGPEIEP